MGIGPARPAPAAAAYRPAAAARSTGKPTIVASSATVSGSSAPSENAIATPNSEVALPNPMREISRNGKNTAATISTSVVKDSAMIRVKAPALGTGQHHVAAHAARRFAGFELAFDMQRVAARTGDQPRAGGQIICRPRFA
jgi:hypothetical protein